MPSISSCAWRGWTQPLRPLPDLCFRLHAFSLFSWLFSGGTGRPANGYWVYVHTGWGAVANRLNPSSHCSFRKITLHSNWAAPWVLSLKYPHGELVAESHGLVSQRQQIGKNIRATPKYHDIILYRHSADCKCTSSSPLEEWPFATGSLLLGGTEAESLHICWICKGWNNSEDPLQGRLKDRDHLK